MQFAFMRFLDRYVGAFLISVFWVMKLVGFPFRRKLRLDKGEIPKCVLVQKFLGVGSIVNAIPLVQTLRKQFPGVKIVFLTFKANKPFLELIQLADMCVVIDDRNFFVFTKSTINALWALSKEDIDISFDLEFFSKFSMITSFLSCAPIRVGFFALYQLRSQLLTNPASFNHYKHISRAYLSMAESIGLEVQESEYCITLPKSESTDQKQLFDKLGIRDSRKYITVNPNASSLCELRKWPPSRYIELVDKLIEAFDDHDIVLIGSPSEKEYVETIYKQCQPSDRLIVAAGRTTLRELMILLEKCKGLISNDSGPVHLAAGYATPTVAIFGPETPVLYGPCNENAVSLYAGLYCSPCINVLDNKSYAACSEVKCMKAISVREVLNAFDAVTSR